MVARSPGSSSRREQSPPERRGSTSREPAPRSSSRSDKIGGVTIEELEKALVIGNDLEQADREQAEAYWRVARAAAISTSRRDAAYQNIKDVTATEDQKTRNSYDKITDKAVESEVRSSPAVRSAIREHLALAEEAAVFQALARSFEMRSYALKDLVLMYLKDSAMQQGKAGDAMADNVRRERNEERHRREEEDRSAHSRRGTDRGRGRD